jgi:hypothetical protein
MTKPAQTFDDDGFDASPMRLQDWVDLIGDDIDEAIDDIEQEGGNLAQLVAFLRAKADELSSIELD